MCKYFMYDPAYIPKLSPHTFDFDFAFTNSKFFVSGTLACV